MELAKQQSMENPVYYVQYAHARICSIFRQAEALGVKWDRSMKRQIYQCSIRLKKWIF